MMGRPRKADPKNKHIGIVTTEKKYRRFKSLNLIGDQAIDVLLFHLEKGDMKLNIKKSETIRRIKSLHKQIEDLEFELLKEETKLEQINSEIGVSNTGLGNDVDRAISNVLARLGNQDVFPLEEALDLKKNEYFLVVNANRCGMDLEEFKKLVIEHS